MIIKSKLFTASTVILSIIIFDQVTKALVLVSTVPFICNIGIAFGVLSGFPNLLIPILVLSVIIYFFVREKRFLNYSSLALIIGGSLSNIIDRLIRGCVVDFIKVVDLFPAFNLADVSITFGVIITVYSMFRPKRT